MPPRPLGKILNSHGIITEEQITQAMAYQQKHACQMGDALIKLGFCTERHVARALAEQNLFPFVDLEETPPQPQALRLISKAMAAEYGVIPVRVDGNRLLVVAQNPFDLRIDAVVHKAAGMPVVVAGGVPSQLKDHLKRYEELKYPKMQVTSSVSTARSLLNVSQQMQKTAQLAETELLPASVQSQTVQTVNLLIADAVRRRSSAIYFEPTDDGLDVRCRIDGYVHSISRVSKSDGDAYLSRVRAMSGIGVVRDGDTATGKCQVRVDGQSIDLTATVIPTARGAMITCLVAAPSDQNLTLEELGMAPELLVQLRRTLMCRQGLVLVAGPVGSGKLTTLHAALRFLQERGVSVSALERTFERKLTGITQFVMDNGGTITVARLLETALNQKPEAVMVGELPDRTAGEVATRAATTGQMIIAGSFAADSISAVMGMLECGVPSHQAAQALRLVVSQRLLRRVCPHCARDYQLPFRLKQALRDRYPIPESATFRKGRGCSKCSKIGSRGCIGVFEVLTLDEDLRHLLAERPAPSLIRDAMTKRSFKTLEQDAFEKICQGLVEPEEILRLGGSVALAFDALSEKAAVQEEACAAAIEAAYAEQPAEEDDLEDWGAVADFAAALSLPTGAAGRPTLTDMEALEPESWDDVADLAKTLGADAAGIF